MTDSVKVLIASSGLGRVQRGVETWALDLALELARRGQHTVLAGYITPKVDEPYLHQVNIKAPGRSSVFVKGLAVIMPSPTWRFGFKSTYSIEQILFWRKLRRELLNITHLHTQDPMLARKSRFSIRTNFMKTILAHGTEESFDYVNDFEYVQHLAPWHYEQAVEWRRGQGLGEAPAGWTTIPNFVDCDVFRPGNGEEKAALCDRFGLSADTLVVGCAAAVKKTHKRLDYLVGEMSRLMNESTRPCFLYIAGSHTEESAGIEEALKALPEGSYHIDYELSRDRMPSFYRSIDVFALCSLYEMMPIALLEALASGLPVYVHSHPVLEWMAGTADSVIDMSRAGSLSSAIQNEALAQLRERGAAARKHAKASFDKRVIVPQIIDYYKRVMELKHD